MRVTRGPRKGNLTANVTPERRQELERLGFERALIYKTAILTGLRLNELRTLSVSDLSFGDVPFIVLRSDNEKNGKGSSVPLRSDLAAELRQWVAGAPGMNWFSAFLRDCFGFSTATLSPLLESPRDLPGGIDLRLWIHDCGGRP